MLKRIAEYLQSYHPEYADIPVEEIQSHLDNPEKLDFAMEYVKKFPHPNDSEVNDAASKFVSGEPTGNPNIDAKWKTYLPPLKNFEQRIQNPILNLPDPKNQNELMTHKMMSFESDGKYYAAPTIVEQNGKLKQLSQDEAFKYAMKNNEFKEFKTDAEAKAYAGGGYKVGTPLEKDYQNWLSKKVVNINDTRKIDASSGLPLNDTNRLHSRNIDNEYLKGIIATAKKHGQDPYTALAIAHQESGLNKDYADNPFFIRFDENKNIDKENADPVNIAMLILKNKQELAKRLGKKDEASQIQAWNGYGKVGKNTEGKNKSFYGIDVSKQDIDMNKNPVYGKRIIDIRDNILKKNPQLIKLVEDAYKK